MRKRKLAFLLFSMTGAGEERIASILLRELSDEYDLHLVIFNGPVDYILPDNIKVTFLRKQYSNFALRSFSLLGVLMKYRSYCTKNNIEISLSFDNVPNYINCLIKILGWKGSVWIREVNFPSRRYSTGLKSMVHRILIKKCYPIADTIYVNAIRIIDDLVSNFNISEARIKIFNNPIDTKLIESHSRLTNEKAKIFTLIHVGAFRVQKNHLLLIKALARIKNLPFQVWFLGKGPLEDDIKYSIESHGLSNKIHILGFKTNPYRYMAAADCMVLSSDFEGLPNVLLEALACKLPIVSTNCPSGPLEVLSGDPYAEAVHLNTSYRILKHGILCPIGNAKILSQAIALCINDTSRGMLDKFKIGMENTIHPYLKDIVVDKFKRDLLSC